MPFGFERRLCDIVRKDFNLEKGDFFGSSNCSAEKESYILNTLFALTEVQSALRQLEYSAYLLANFRRTQSFPVCNLIS